MKKKLLHLFAVCMAIVMAIPIALANPANYKITFNSTAVATHQVSLYTGTGSAQQMSVANDVMYTIMPANSGKQVSYYDCSTKTLGAINTGSTNLISCGSATDDSGNLIVGVEQSFFYSTVNTIKVFKANKSGVVSTSSTKTYNLGRSGTNAFRTDMWHASGDIYGGNGSLWFSNGTYIVEVPIKNGTVQSIITHTTPSTPGGLSDNGWASQTRLAPYGNSNEFVYNNGQGVYDITINNSTITGTKLTAYSRHGGDIEYLRGHKIFARNANAAVNDGYITIEDITTGTAQTIQSAFLVAQGVGGFTGQTNVWCEFKLIDDNTLALYTFVPKGGFSKYLITATPDVSNITSLSYKREESNGIQNIKLSWTAPSKGVLSEYYIYRGNSLIGKTTATSYTDQNVFENATYKVVPVFDGVPEDSEYGATVTTTDVVTCTDPVTNVTVAYNNNVGNSIVVSWDAPNGVIAPNTYQVCYSSNNGTSWSNVVETTDLTYTFTDLTVGTYIFKVTPVYGSSLGEDSQSEVIEVIKTGITFTTTKLWESKGEIATADLYDSRGIAVSNNKAYIMAAKHTSAISYVDFDNKDRAWSSFETGFNAQIYGYAIDNDDSGNIIIQSAPRYGEAATQLTIYPAGATSNANKKNITLSGEYLPNSRADFFAAQGNLLSDEGGYLWMVPISDQKIIRLRIVNGNITGVDTWPQTFATSANQNQIIIRPLLDGRLYIHHRANEYKIINLPAPGTEITSNMIELLSTPTAEKLSYSYVGSDMFILQGHTFHVRNDGTKDKGIGIAIKNLTEKDKEGNGDATYTPFNGKDVNGADNGITGIAGYGSVVRAVKVNDYNYDVYSHSPNHGVTVYRVSAKASNIKTDKLSLLSYNYLESTDAEGNKVQDIKLTWEAPKDATPSKYKVYRDGSPLATVDASTLTYTDNGVTQNHTYKVVPIFTGVNEDAEHGLSVTTTEVESTEVESILYAPEITEIRNHDGYSIVEIFYKMPAESKTEQIAYYNIYRNGVLLETGLTQYNFIDDQLPKIDKAVDYTYIVEAVYKPEYDNATRTSKKETVTVKARDWSLSGYQLQEVYNIPISPEIGNLPNNFTNEEYYRQGHFYNGSWYIAQRADNLAKRDDPNYTASDKNTEIVSAKAGTTGGVVSIKAIEENDVLTGFTGKPITSEAFASVGLAIDDAGNVFMRHNNGSNADMATTAPAKDQITGLPVNWLGYISDGFTRRITRGAIYKHKGDGTYETEPIVINLNALWLSNDWINTMAFSYEDSGSGDKNGQVTGRSDYYYMYGDVMSAEGGYLLLSPSWTRTIFKVKIANGKYVNHETHELNQYQSKEGMVDVTVGTGNYGFRIDGRNAWIAQLRSSGYFGIHGEEDHAEEGEEAHEHEMHAIFVTDSRINNTGGTSIVAFNSAEGANDGETFLITPTNMHSRNYGDFIVTRGTKTNTTDPASEAKFMPPMPVAQIKQTNISENLATNASGNWFHAEVGTYESATGEQSECVYIYQYVPGIRFAKYRLVSDLTLPVVYPTLEIKTAYNDDETDITHFDGIVTWERPQGFGITNADEASVWIKSYTVELVDAKGNVVETVEVKSDVEDENGNCEFNYFEYLAGLGKLTSDCELDFQTYTARVAVNYELKNGDIQQSSFNYASASNTYVAKAANNPSAYTYKNTNAEIEQWVEKENGEWVVEKKPVDSYRIELNFDAADGSEPVSYYTIKAIRNKVVNGEKVTDEFEITDFDLHMGETIENGVIRANNVKTSQIPGDYDFDANRAPFYKVGDNYTIHTGGQSRQKSVLTWHHTVAPGTYSNTATTADGDTEVIMEPDNWEYYVVAHYAANNRAIAKEAVAVVEKPAPGFIETGVEVIGEDEASSLKIYPIPASTEITIKSHEAINSIVIYNEVGVEMMSLVGDGETTTVVNIEDLPTGYYFVRVNSQPPVKIIKK